MADEKLTGALRPFVAKVSTPVLMDLLNDLYTDRVLNDRERESVVEEYRARADRATCLIDMVRRKGDAASKRMIAHLEIRDPNLHSILFLLPELPAQAAGSALQDRPISAVLTHSTEAFMREKLRTDEYIYPVIKSRRRRLALLIVNRDFDYEAFTRKGAEKDEENMNILLPALGCEVVKRKNRTGQEIDADVRDFSKRPDLFEAECVFVVISSHGINGAVCGVDCPPPDPKNKPDKSPKPYMFPINNIYKYLNTENCPALENIPKIIIIQACRGGKDGSVVVGRKAGASASASPPAPSMSADTDGLEEDGHLAHTEKDFVCLLSCTPGTVSYRNKTIGSVLIHFLFQVFNTFSHVDHIEELFTKVLYWFENHFPADDKKQMPTKERCTLTKHFYLFPGVWHTLH